MKRVFLAFLIFLSLLLISPLFGDNLITTVAGIGVGDNGPATSAWLRQPWGLALNQSGSLLIADSGNRRIRKVIISSGIISTVVGNGFGADLGDGRVAVAASMDEPRDVAVDSFGNTYIATPYNGRVRKVSSTGIMSTCAGNGDEGYSGDGGPATEATLNEPQAVAVDPLGNLFIADTNNHRIRKVDRSTGIITTVAGDGIGRYSGDNGPATEASLRQPYGIAFDSQGNLYIADMGNHRIRKVFTDGTIVTVAGCGVNSFGGDGYNAVNAYLNSPHDVAVDSSGQIFIADQGNCRICKVATNGIISTVAGTGMIGYSGDGGPATSAAIGNPVGIVVDTLGNIYFADSVNGRVRKITASNNIINTFAGQAPEPPSGDGGLSINAYFSMSSCTAFSPLGDLYFVDSDYSRVRKVHRSTGIITTVAGTTSYGYSGDGGLATSAQLDSPFGIVFAPNGDLYIADSWNHRIRKVTAATGIISTYAGNGSGESNGDGGLAVNAGVSFPMGIALDAAGNLYISEMWSHRIRKVDATTKIISHFAGTGTPGYSGDGTSAATASLNTPLGLATDSSGNLYICDVGNNRIRKVSGGIITTVVGGEPGFSGDNGPASQAAIDMPFNVCADIAGNIYFTDYFNSRVRKITASTGIITTLAGNGTYGFSGDGGSATSAALHTPMGVAVNPLGVVAICDSGNSRIRVVAPGGTQTSPANFVRYGWNLVSVPADPVNPDPLAVFSGLDVPNSSLQYWRNVEGGGFQGYGASAGWLGPIRRGSPYWLLNLGSNKTLSFPGFSPLTDFTLTIPQHVSAPFWVMFGTPFGAEVPCTSVFFTNTSVSPTPKSWVDAYAANMVESKALGFDASTQQFVTVGPSQFSPNRTSLEPWYGYWLLVNRPEQLTITFTKP